MKAGMKSGYGAELSHGWAAHLAPREEHAPTVVSTFAGCGGSSLGYSMAGYRELLAVEWDDHAVDRFRANFPHVRVHHGDIADVDPDALGLAPGELDVLDGSPPCQGFSATGRKRLDDPRNQLFREFVRLLTAWRPRVFVMENVPGMIRGAMKPLFAEILAELKAAGYRVAARVMDASYFRVPQARRRMIFVGVRDDLDIEPVHPAPAYPPMPVREAWTDLDSIGLTEDPIGRAAQFIAAVPAGGAADMWMEAHNRKGSFFSLQRLHWNRPAFTITKDFSAHTNGKIHPVENRYVGSRELTRLQGFPDEYDWAESTYTQINNRVGNSVPPPLMRAIAETVRGRILEAP